MDIADPGPRTRAPSEPRDPYLIAPRDPYVTAPRRLATSKSEHQFRDWACAVNTEGMLLPVSGSKNGRGVTAPCPTVRAGSMGSTPGAILEPVVGRKPRRWKSLLSFNTKVSLRKSPSNAKLRKQGGESQLYCESHVPHTPPPAAPLRSQQRAPNQPRKRTVRAITVAATDMDDKTRHELWTVLERMQGGRIEDQRCALPNLLQNACLNQLVKDNNNVPSPGHLLSGHVDTLRSLPPEGWLPDPALAQILRGTGPYPMIVPPKNGGYWIDDACAVTLSPEADDRWRSSPPRQKRAPGSCELEVDETAKCYRKHFLGREHFNFYGDDVTLGALVMSIKGEAHGEQEQTRVILRRKNCTLHKVIASENNQLFNPASIAKELCPSLSADLRLQPVLHPHGSDLIVSYDDHSVPPSAYKFGVVYQRFGQTLEEEVFGNESHGAAMDRFLEILGSRVALKGFTGFRGGLDTQHGQTGEESVYTRFAEREVMFHVSTLLPYSPHDQQQLQRKRHIGNDIVALVFQEDNTPFVPDMIASQFLHAYIVVQPLDPCSPSTAYKVSVTARCDVPAFGPSLTEDGVFTCADELREFLLTKLINAEHACYRAPQFAKLEERTRKALLEQLVSELESKNRSYLQHPPSPQSAKPEGSSSSGLFDTFKRAISGKGNKKSKGMKRIQSEGSTIQRRVVSGGGGGEHSPCACPKQRSITESTSLSSYKQHSLGESVSVSSYKTCSDSPCGTPRSSPGEHDPTHKRRGVVSRSSSSSSIYNYGDTAPGGGGGGHEDSDTGMESMSSTETPGDCSGREAQQQQLRSLSEDRPDILNHNESLVSKIESLETQVHTLSTEKSHLQNLQVSSQKEIERLRERENRLSAELTHTLQELKRLKVVVMDVSPEATV